jgi:hypothetical protein
MDKTITKARQVDTELANYILASDESEEQKEYWLDIMPSFTPIHIERLKGIYRRHEETMNKLDKKFEGCKNTESKADILKFINN